MSNLSSLTTEQRNDHTTKLDSKSVLDILTIINKEDMAVAESVQKVLPEIEKAVKLISKSLQNGGRLFYIGAGTSGRIGILDAVECVPTFRTPPGLVQGIIAGGTEAIINAAEGAEDDELEGEKDLKEKQLTSDDVVLGIAASGRTPYVIGALKYPRKIGAKRISLASNEDSLISKYSDVKIEVITGPEVLTGSTRMKAGTAHKIILNMISTTTMIKAGKVYENLMVDLKATNYKLKQRANSMLSAIADVDEEESAHTLEVANYEVKPAILMLLCNVNYKEAKLHLERNNGLVRNAIHSLQK